MTENTIYRFTFDKPVEFRRVYNFLSPFEPANNSWIPQDSSEFYVAEYQTKNTLVYDMSLTYRQQKSKINSYYYVTLRGTNTCDTFKVSAYDISNLLEIFSIM